MWWCAAAWAGLSATVAISDHGGPEVSWTVDTAAAHPPVTWTGPDGELRRALVTGVYGMGVDHAIVLLQVQTLRRKRWVDEKNASLMRKVGGEASVLTEGRDGEPAAWGFRVQFTRTEGPEVIWLSAFLAPGDAVPPRGLSIAPGLVCEGLEVTAEDDLAPVVLAQVVFSNPAGQSGAVRRWSCSNDAGTTPVEVRLVVW
jgi:hypothetical protein